MGKHFEKGNKKYISIIIGAILVLILVIAGICIYFNVMKNKENSNNVTENTQTNNTNIVNNTINNETNNTNTSQNTTDENVVNNIATNESKTNANQSGATTTIQEEAGIEEKQQDTSVPNSEKAENLVASKRGNPSSEYYEAILQEGSKYRVTVRRKSDTNVIAFYNVNVSTGEVIQE